MVGNSGARQMPVAVPRQCSGQGLTELYPVPSCQARAVGPGGSPCPWAGLLLCSSSRAHRLPPGPLREGSVLWKPHQVAAVLQEVLAMGSAPGDGSTVQVRTLALDPPRLSSQLPA